MKAEEMMKTLDDWKQEKLKLFRVYRDNGAWTLNDYERAKQQVLNPPEWFKEQFERG